MLALQGCLRADFLQVQQLLCESLYQRVTHLVLLRLLWRHSIQTREVLRCTLSSLESVDRLLQL